MRIRCGKSRGFTLVEVLIAIIVVAIAGVMVSSSIGNVVSQMYTLERRTMAHWVGENHLNRLQMEQIKSAQPLSVDNDSERVLMAGREWLVEVDVTDTDSESMWRGETSVYELIDGDQIGPLDTMITFVGQY